MHLGDLPVFEPNIDLFNNNKKIISALHCKIPLTNIVGFVILTLWKKK